jgi:hypothetical protein
MLSSLGPLLVKDESGGEQILVLMKEKSER